jgi:D-3-phosphoglycerate dehydrogenase / 2-oxoglutarate reductase
MSKPVVLVTQTTVAKEAQQLLRDAGLEIVFMRAPIDEKALLAEFSRHQVVAVLLRGPAPFTPAVFAGAKHLRIIAKHGAGIDSVNLESATASGVAVMVTEGANGDAVAEHALALMLSLARELPRFDRELRKGVWKNLDYRVRDFRGRSVGIVGYGQIGSRTARLASACGARVVVHSRTRPDLPPGMEWEDGLDGVLGRADILSLHCPLTPETRGLIGEKQLRIMKRGALIINTSRGKLIDEPALIAALKSGHLGGAGLDTYATEPPDLANPLFSMPNVILTPHIASSTMDAGVQMGTIAARNIISYLRGEIYDRNNFVNPSVHSGGR